MKSVSFINSTLIKQFNNMAQQKDRNFVGSGKKVANYDMVNITLCVTDIPKAEIYEYNGKKYLNLTIGAKRDGADQYGKTHSIWINDFKPDKTKAKGQDVEKNQAELNSYDQTAQEEINPNDIPF